MSLDRTFPLLADGTLPPLILLVRWLALVQEAGITLVTLELLPPGNGSIPDLLQMGGVTRVNLASPPIPGPFLWEGCAGARVVVGEASPDQDLPLHHGHLPVSARPEENDSTAINALIELARLEDANAIFSPGSGASWDHILAAAGLGQAPRIPPLATHAMSTQPGRLGAWNPLPFTRDMTVALAMDTGAAPWGLGDAQGARYQVQVVEGPVGREMISAMRLRALECVPLTALEDPIAGTHWEVSRTVLDNGIVRAELDPLGQVVRLCFAGHFIALSGPALHAQVDGLPFSGASTTTVLEEGPVRSRVAVTRSGALGTLHLIYTLHAHERVLRVSASWDGQAELRLDHPTSHRGAVLASAGEVGSWRTEQAASILRQEAPVQRGLRWAQLCESNGDGLALAAARPISVSAQAGHLRVHVDRSASYALCGVVAGEALVSLPRTSLALSVPGRSFGGEAVDADCLPLLPDASLACWWISRPKTWRGELLVSEWQGRRGSSVFMRQSRSPDQPPTEAWRVDASGTPLARLPDTPERDGFILDMAAYDIAIVRWR